MHIVFCLDNNYISHCATVIASIINHNEKEEITFHLLSDYISEENTKKLLNWINSFNSKYIEIHIIDINRFNIFPVGEAYINISTYFRLLIPNILKDISKVIYLDCDVIINSPLTDLWKIDINNYALGGVLDRISDYIRVYNRLGYPPSKGYINAGVLLINLEYWRKVNVFSQAIDIAKRIPLHLKNHDQDILNIIFHDSKLILDFKYNLLEYYLYTENWLYLNRKYYPEIIEACKNPVIVHFCMPQKPWHFECINPYKELYYKYRKMTPWPELKLTHKKEKLSKKQKLKLALEKLGLYKVERKSTLRKDINNIEEPNNILF